MLRHFSPPYIFPPSLSDATFSQTKSLVNVTPILPEDTLFLGPPPLVSLLCLAFHHSFCTDATVRAGQRGTRFQQFLSTSLLFL